MLQIDRLIISRIATPLGLTLLVAVLLLLLEQMLSLFNFVVEENGPADIVWEMLALLIPQYVGQTLPLGLFVAILVMIRGLSLSSELDVILAGGISWRRLLRPIYGMSLAVFFASILIQGYVQPYALYRYIELLFEARSGALGAKVDIGEFVELSDGITLHVGGSRDGGRELTDLFLERVGGDNQRQAATAKRGAFFATDDPDTVILRLYDGRQLDFTDRREPPRTLSYEVLDIAIDLPQIAAFRDRGADIEELTFDELRDFLTGRLVEGAPSRQEVRAAVHRFIQHHLGFLIIPLLAVAFGKTDRRRDSGVGLIVGIAMVIVYNELVEAGERAVAAGGSPWLAQWPLTLGIAVMTLRLYYVVTHLPGGRALGDVERALGDGVRWLRSMLERRQQGRAA